MNYALKEANDTKLYQKKEKERVLYLQEKMGKTILKLATLKNSARLNMKQIREEHNKALSAAKDNGKTENIEEIENLCQLMEGKKGDVKKIGEEWDMLMEQIKSLKNSFN